MTTQPDHTHPTRTVLRCGETADFLGVLPVMMGYTVTNSLVVALFSHSRTTSAMRFDLPRPDTPPATTGLDAKILALLSRIGGVTGVSLIFYTDETFADQGAAPRIFLARWLEREIEAAGFSVMHTCCVAADGWVDFQSPSQVARPVNEITEGSGSLEATLTLSKPVQQLSTLGVLPGHDESLRTLISITLGDASRRPLTPQRAVECLDAVRSAGVSGATIDSCTGVVRAAASTLTWLVLLASVAIGSTGAENMFDRVSERDLRSLLRFPLRTLNADDPERTIATLLRKFSAEKIPQPRVRDAIARLSTLAAHTPRQDRQGLLALLAWLWWMVGMTSPAILQIHESLEIDAQHELTLMVQDLVDQGPPLWLFSQTL